ncbi:MAG: hypothetical protein CL842_13315 [Crocinitomicaceae bacterium]|nr:hypothetical protein [Crocinitomicaceae bacterium]|tara:strand:- start:21303 stop:21647 length:345 start_codon:yes stop_codon:yes gene_type:complete
MENIILPGLGGLVLFLVITLLGSLGGFLFKLKVIKSGDLSKYNKSQIITELGDPVNIINEEENQVLVWLKSSGTYMLKIEYTNQGDFVKINQQLDQTKNGLKGFLYNLILKFIK